MKLTERQIDTLTRLEQENRECYCQWVGSTPSILGRLVERELVSVRRRRLSNVYRITDAGRIALAQATAN